MQTATNFFNMSAHAGIGALDKLTVQLTGTKAVEVAPEDKGFLDIMGALMEVAPEELQATLDQLVHLSDHGQKRAAVPLIDLSGRQDIDADALQHLFDEATDTGFAPAVASDDILKSMQDTTGTRDPAENTPLKGPGWPMAASMPKPAVASDIRHHSPPIQQNGQPTAAQANNGVHQAADDVNPSSGRAMAEMTEDRVRPPSHPVHENTLEKKDAVLEPPVKAAVQRPVQTRPSVADAPPPKQAMSEVELPKPSQNESPPASRQPAADPFPDGVKFASEMKHDMGRHGAGRQAPGGDGHGKPQTAEGPKETPVRDHGDFSTPSLEKSEPAVKNDLGRTHQNRLEDRDIGWSKSSDTSGPAEQHQAESKGLSRRVLVKEPEAPPNRHVQVQAADERQAPQPTKDLHNDIMRQIVQRMTMRSSGRRSSMNVQLKPEFLGNVHMQISTENQQVAVRMTAESVVVKEMIEQHMQHLRSELQQHGLEVDKFEVHVGNDNENWKSSQENAGFRHAMQQKKGARLRQRSGGREAESDGSTDRQNTGSADDSGEIDYFV